MYVRVELLLYQSYPGAYMKLSVQFNFSLTPLPLHLPGNIPGTLTTGKSAVTRAGLEVYTHRESNPGSSVVTAERKIHTIKNN
jgi:hypothetical protein